MAHILITSGPTREPLDPVRFLSNASSGRMGAALATEALRRGHTVDLVTGPVEVAPPTGARLHPVETTLQMLAVCHDLHRRCDIVIGAAAVCDFRPRRRLESKRARESRLWTLELVANPDILAELGRKKGERAHIGFALETTADAPARKRAREKLEKKNLDWIVLNPTGAIGSGEGHFVLIPRQGPEIDLGQMTKAALATALFDRL